MTTTIDIYGFSDGSDGKESALQCRIRRFNFLIEKTCRRREWQPTPGFLPGKSHGQRILVGYSPWSCKESDMTERLTFSLFFSTLFNLKLRPMCLFSLLLFQKKSLLKKINLNFGWYIFSSKVIFISLI